MRQRTRIALLASLLLAVGAATAVAMQQRRETFPHRRHEGLFPLCTGCHEMDAASRVDRFPAQDLCARCHDGEQQRRVSWSPPAQPVTNLTFDHADHSRVTANEDSPLTCATCHVEDQQPTMRVVPAAGARCVQCHAHQAQDHTVDADCATCHIPLAETAFDAARIAALPKPATHEQQSFLLRVHGRSAETSTASCAVCHARQTCTTCHVNATSVSQIAAMPEAPESMTLPELRARYPRPASHSDEFFSRTHGAIASLGACSTCHARESCETCHAASPPLVVTALPSRAEAQARGVNLRRVAPLSHSAPGFASEHGPLASADGASCTQCHAANTCADCHDASSQPVFHPADFMLRHSSAAYGGRLECANCHDTRVFCQECHRSSGFQSQGSLGPGFHTAEPLWLLRHGGAARRGLESCTTCHAQRDCLQCHSTLGAFRVSPHGSAFDARRAQERNAAICRACHVRDPLGGERSP
ncbi:MAG: cytochrome c3 family protein [Gemmatimonadota bacterium]|jgi:hypothetical protein